MGEAINLVENFKVERVIFNCGEYNDLGVRIMIIINSKSYENNKVNVSFGNYNIIENGKKRQGISPFISFKCDNAYIGIEMTYEKKWLTDMEINSNIEITKYISDIIYEDKKGCISLICGKYNCYLEKISNNHFIIKLIYEAKECNENFKIYINEHVIINF